MSGGYEPLSLKPGRAPSGWEWALLTDVAKLESGHTPSRRVPEYWEGGTIPWLSLKDIKRRVGMYVHETADQTTQLGIDNSSARVLPARTVALCRTASVGKVAVLGRDMATSQDFVNWVCGPRLHPEYLYYALVSSPTFFDAQKQGSTHKTIYFPTVQKFHVLLPPLPEQKRIAAILDKADEIRRKRQEAIRLTEELLRSAFLEMCGPQARDYATWPVRTIESLARQENGSMRTGPFGSDLRHSEFVGEGVFVLGIDNAVKNRFAWGERRFITEEKYERLKRYTVFPGDVIVTIMGTTGRSAVVPDDIPAAITTKHLATITLDRNAAEPEFVAQALHRHPEVLAQIEGAQRGAIMSGLNLGLIKRLQLRVPPVEVQRNFARATVAVRAHEAKLRAGHEALLVASLTQRAFSAKL